LLQAAGLEGVPQPTDAKTLAGMQLLSGLAPSSSADSLQVIATATGYRAVRFLCRLNREHLRVDETGLQGEATILAKVQRKLGRADVAEAVDIPMLRHLPPAKRKEFFQIFGKPEIEGMQFGDSVVRYPGAVLTVLAIYR